MKYKSLKNLFTKGALLIFDVIFQIQVKILCQWLEYTRDASMSNTRYKFFPGKHVQSENIYITGIRNI